MGNDAYDAIVIGTGFGATIAATRLALKGKKTLMMERGTWWVTPETLGKPPVPAKKPLPQYAAENNEIVQYWPRPDHKEGLIDLLAAFRSDLNKEGLYQYSIFKQIHILTASGVGGGSLIYSNVTLRPEDEVLQGLGLNLGDPEYQAAVAWMEDYRGKLNKVVTKIPLPGRDVANLGPDDYLLLDRSRALRDAAAKVSGDLGIQIPWKPLDLAIIEYTEDANRKSSADGAKTHTNCERQGRCIFGCLPAARYTLNKTIYNRLLLDPNAGVTLMPLVKVLYITQTQNGYSVRYEDRRDGGKHKSIEAPMVFLGAGTLGTTEILLRSRDDHDFPLNDRLGSQFSTNGDFAGFAVNTANSVFSTRGPINTSHIHAKLNGLHVAIEDCAIPSMVAQVASAALQVLDNAAQSNSFLTTLKLAFQSKILPDLGSLLPDTKDPNKFKTEAEMVQNTFFFNSMGQDDASGKIFLDHDQIQVDWDTPIANHRVFQEIEFLQKSIAEAMGGRYVSSPLWQGLANRKLICVHPLGGCPIGQDNSKGVVDEFGRVFDGSKSPGSTDTLDGLYVVDGAAIPGALVANPSLTISAQAIKTVSKALP
jgi:cholesterol oxidase